MAVEDSLICKYNQTGFCKYREGCKNKHVNDKCEKSKCDEEDCEKRHPKECKKYSNNKCRFNKECGYRHCKTIISTDQNQVNEAVATVTIKQEKGNHLPEA